MTSKAHGADRPALDESLNDSEYDRLTEIMGRFPSEEAMNLEEMDGLFASLICGPVAISPSACLSEIWGDEEAPFEEMDDLDEFLNLAMRHWNFIARELASPDMIFIPWLEVEEDEETPRGNRWAPGFMKGIDHCRESWDEIFADEDKFAILLPMLALVHENDPDPEMRSWPGPPERELRERVLIDMAAATQKLYDYFRSHRSREAHGKRPVHQAAPKIGRNDPCYCGSGKKYKRCCGNGKIN